MTNGALVTLAVGATGLLVLGARLLEDPTTSALVGGIASLLIGTALAAAAVAGAWRSPRSATTEDAAPAPRPTPSTPRRG